MWKCPHITDHLPNFIVRNNGKPLDSKIKVTRRDYSKFVEQDYLHSLDNIEVSELMMETNDTNEKYDIFHSHIHTVLDKHAPLKKLPGKKLNNYTSHGQLKV